MTIRAGQPERADARAQRSVFVFSFPWDKTSVNKYGRIIPVYLTIGFVKMDGRRDLFMLEREGGFDETDQAGSEIKVPKVGLDRPDPAEIIFFCVFTKSLGDALNLDRIP